MSTAWEAVSWNPDDAETERTADSLSDRDVVRHGLAGVGEDQYKDWARHRAAADAGRGHGDGDGAPLAIEVHPANGGVALQVSGEIDLSNVSVLGSTIDDHRQSLRVLDLRGVDFIDCRGMALLVDAATSARSPAKRVPILASTAVQRLANLLADASQLEIAADRRSRRQAKSG